MSLKNILKKIISWAIKDDLKKISDESTNELTGTFLLLHKQLCDAEYKIDRLENKIYGLTTLDELKRVL